MKIGIFSDLHLRKGGKKIEGWDRRTLDGLSVLNQIVDIFFENRIDKFYFLGDMFHQRYQLDVQVLSGAVDIMKRLVDIPGIFIPGNHDIYYRDESWINSLASYSLKWVVVDRVYVSDGIVCFPYTENISDEIYLELKKSGVSVLMMHQFIKDFPVHSGYTVKNGEVFDRVNDFDFIFAGHSHIPKTLSTSKGMFVNVGAPMEHSFQDSNTGSRGCVIFDIGTKKVEWFLLDYPKYKVVSDIKEITNSDDYYRLVLKEDEFSKTIQIPENVQLTVIQEEQKLDRLNLGEKWSWDDVIDKYVELKAKTMSGGSKFFQKCKTVGKQILGEVKDD